ncbi:ComEC/Rec2 family competence protein [Erwiniaceae bacterium CAU 1747]
MLKIRMLKAGNGDCIFIQTDCEFILIDGGTAQSFNDWKECIIGHVSKIDSIIVTHIDNDHINGIIKLLDHPDCPTIGQVYFNGAEQLFGKLNEFSQTERTVEMKLLALSEECSAIEEKELIGYSEGTSLSYILSSKGIECNPVVSGGAVYRGVCEFFEIGSIKFTLISPIQDSLYELQQFWQCKLAERRIKPRVISKNYYDAFEKYIGEIREDVNENHKISSVNQCSVEALANTKFEDDTSPTNRSSFSFLVEFDGKRILYLGDCNATVVTDWLELQNEKVLNVDIVKISHHGSKNNTNLELLRRINSPKYFISTNGNSHGHPDLETLARIAFVNSNKEIEIYFNYALDVIPDWFIADIAKNYPMIKFLMNSCEVEL